MQSVGIDIGTCFSSAAILKPNGEAEALKINMSGTGDVTAMPTAVYYDKSGRLYIGADAESRAITDPARYREHFKKSFGDSRPLHIGDGNYATDELYTEVFIDLKNKLTEMHGEEDWLLCVTHPASYHEDKRRLLEKAANRAGFMKVLLLDEPTAAAIMYSKKSKVQTGETLLVYDFGGGTFDLSLIKKTENGYRQLAEPIGKEIGGTDIDELLLNDMVTKLL
ncbi:MAG: Hsp70 family protein, partial [Lachnospiraceae bacterium]|nr:Hsp70 family protein [Lachnospiraceae bacterium]